MNSFTIQPEPVGRRPFSGLGVQADASIYHEVNRVAGVDEGDLELIARRVRCLRPAIARLFVKTHWFEISIGKGESSVEFAALLRQLRLLKETETSVNLVLISPDPWGEPNLEPAVRRMIDGLVYLRDVEECSHIRWLTLWNEPDYSFSHGSELGKRLFGDKPSPSTWEEYVRLNRLAYELLQRTGLSATVKLVVADTVWGPVMRAERMELALAAFGDLEVAYSYHTYSHEGDAGSKANPDYYYLGMEEEAARFRELLGPERELVCWEFNTSGVEGFGTYFAGIGPQGEDRISSVRGAVDLADKVLSGMAGGVEGLSLWCLHDMIYGGMENPRLMEFGLWRFKRQNWYPRPIYHYYAPLVAAFRPGVYVHRVVCKTPGLKAIAARAGEGEILALLNTGDVELQVPVRLPADASLVRIRPSQLPAFSDLPLHTRLPAKQALSPLVLESGELTFVSSGGYSLNPGV